MHHYPSGNGRQSEEGMDLLDYVDHNTTIKLNHGHHLLPRNGPIGI